MMSNEHKPWNGVCFYLGEINGKSYSVGVDGFGMGALTFTLLEELERPTSHETLLMKPAGCLIEASRIPGSESYELTITPIDD